MKLTNEQIDERLATMNMQIALNDETRQRLGTNSALLRASIAELEAQRPKDLYVVLGRKGWRWCEPNSLSESSSELVRANEVGDFAPYTLHKLTPCNADGSVRS